MSEVISGAKPHLLSLPYEILDHICGFLPSRPQRISDVESMSSLAAVRLTSKSLAAVAAKHAFSALSFTIIPKSISNLQAISQDPLLSRLVRSLTFELDLLPSYDSRRDFIRGAVRQDSVPAGLSTDQIRYSFEAWDNYKAIRDYQLHFWYREYHEETHRVFPRLLANFTNLEVLEVKKEPYRMAWTGVSTHNHYMGTCLLPGPLDLTRGVVLLTTFFRALSQSRVSPKEVFLLHVPTELFASFLDIFAKMCYDEGLINPFQRLRSLRVSLSPAGWRSADLEDPSTIVVRRHGLLVELLHQAPKLERLELSCGSYANISQDLYPEPCPGVSLQNSFSPMVWQNLRCLSLTWLRISSWNLLGLLHSHAPTLKTLGLGEIQLSDGHWAETFDHIQDMGLQLVHFYLRFTDRLHNIDFFGDVKLRADRSVEFVFWNLAFQSVRLWSTNKLGRLLTGRVPEGGGGDNDITKCVDWWLRRGAFDRVAELGPDAPSDWVDGRLMGGTLHVHA